MATTPIQELGALLADLHILYQKLRGYHWNVRGPHFYELHEHFEELYDGLAETIDDVAERIRGLGAFPPATYSEYLQLATLQEDPTQPDATTMLKNLVQDYETFLGRAAEVRELFAADGDEETVDQIIGMRHGMQKDLWMLRSNLG